MPRIDMMKSIHRKTTAYAPFIIGVWAVFLLAAKPAKYDVHTYYLENQKIDESSGIAPMRSEKAELLWTHNDSGDSPRIFAINTQGAHIATVNIKGAKAADWEDMASFTDTTGKNWLIIADTGANNHKDKIFSLYIMAEPDLDELKLKNSKPITIEKSVHTTIKFSWPNGCRSDCEAIAVDPYTNKIYLAQKFYKRIGFELYTINLPIHLLSASPTASITLTPKKLCSVPNISCVTAMDISADARHMIFLTYNGAYEFSRQTKQSWQEVLTDKSHPATRIKLPPLKQSEAICYGPKGEKIYVTSEKLPATLVVIDRPKPENK